MGRGKKKIEEKEEKKFPGCKGGAPANQAWGRKLAVNRILTTTNGAVRRRAAIRVCTRTIRNRHEEKRSIHDAVLTARINIDMKVATCDRSVGSCCVIVKKSRMTPLDGKASLVQALRLDDPSTNA